MPVPANEHGPDGQNEKTGAGAQRITRRGFLRAGILGGGLLAVGAGTLAVLRREDVPLELADRLVSIEPALFAVLVAFSEAVLPPEADAVAVSFLVDERLSHANAALIKDVNLGLSMLENGVVGIFTRGGMGRFSALSLVQRQEALYRWRDSWIGLLGMAYHGIRKLCLGCYYGLPDAGKSAGYPGPPFHPPEPGPRSPRGPLAATMVSGGATSGEATTGVDPNAVPLNTPEGKDGIHE